MKRKWLISIAAVAMAVTLSVGLAACAGEESDGDKDRENVSYVIDSLNEMYATESMLTPVSYTVTHAIMVDGKPQPVEWSVSAVTEGITLSDFVGVGTPDEAKNETPIQIKQNSQVIDYKLTATVTIGEVTDSVSYDRQIPHIYTVAEAKALVNGFSSQQYYKVDNEVVEVVVKGYVVDVGQWNSTFSNFQKVYIADSATETDTSNRCQVFGLILDNVYLTKQEDLVEGAEIIVAGALQYYSGPEIIFYNEKNIKARAVYYKLPDLSDEDIVDRALAKLSIPQRYIKEGTHTLPTALEDATISWAVTAGSEYASVSGGTLTLANLPAKANMADVTLTATATKGSSHKDKGFTVKVYKANFTNDGTASKPYTPAEAEELAQTLASGTYYEKSGNAVDVYVKGKVVSCEWAGETYKNFNNVYLIEESTYTAEATKDSDGVFMVYRIKKHDLLPNANSLANGDTVVVKGNLQNFNGTYQLGHKGDSTSSSELISYTSGMTAEQKVAAAVAEAKALIPTTLRKDFTLPTSRFSDVTLTFTSSGTAITVNNGKLTVTRPTDANATVTITVKAECGTESKEETVTVTVPKALNMENANPAAKVIIADYATAHAWVNNENEKSMSVVIDANITATVSGTPVKVEYGLNTGNYHSSTGTWRIYQNENPTLKFEAQHNAHILTIKITYAVSNTGILSSADKAVNYASDEVIEVDAAEVSFTVGQTADKTNGQVQITAIEVVYSGGTAVHQHSGLTYDGYNNWTHTAHCAGTDCDWENNTHTENCTPVNNVCACGHTFTIEEIAAKVKSYSSNTNLPGTYELTGVVTGTVTKSNNSNDKYKFNMTVGTETVIAYFVIINEAGAPEAGDTVTIRGSMVAYKQSNEMFCEFAEGGNITALTKKVLTPEEKAQKAADALAKEVTKKDYDAVEDITLPTTNEYSGTVTWTVKSGDDNNTYVAIETSPTLKIKSLPTDGEVTIVLEVSVVVNGSEAKKATVTIKLHANGSIVPGDGTKDHPYTVAEVLAYLADLKLADNAYTEKEIYVRGYVCTGFNGWSGNYKNWQYVYLVDDVADISNSSATRFQVFKLYPDTTKHILELSGDLYAGSEIVVYGFIQNYKGKNSNTLEMTTKSNSTNPMAYSYTDARSDAQKANDAIAAAKKVLDALTLTQDVAEYALPASTVTGVTLSYAGTGVQNNKLTITQTSDVQTLTITIDATINDANGTRASATVTVAAKAPDRPQDAKDVEWTITDYYKLHGWTENTNLTTVDIDNNIEASVALNDGSQPVWNKSKNDWRLYTKNTLTFTAKNEAQIFSIVITYGGNDNGVGSLLNSDGTITYASGTTIYVNGTSVTLKLSESGQVRITAITVTYTGGQETTDKFYADMVKDAIEIDTENTLKTNLPLPTIDHEKVELDWTIENEEDVGEAAKVENAAEGGGKQITVTRQDDDVTFTLKLIVKYNGASSDAKTFTLTVEKKPAELQPGVDAVVAKIEFAKGKFTGKNTSGYTSSTELTNEDGTTTWTLDAFNNNSGNWNEFKTGRKDDPCVGKITTKAAMNYVITEVVVKTGAVTTSAVSSFKLLIADNKEFTGAKEVTISIAANAENKFTIPQEMQGLNKYYRIEITCTANANGSVAVASLSFTGHVPTDEEKSGAAAASIAYSAPVADLPNKD